MDQTNLEPMSLEDSIISLKAGSTTTGALLGCPQKMMLQVWRALRMGDTMMRSTSIPFIFSLASRVCFLPSSVISTSRNFSSNFSLIYSSSSRKSGPYLCSSLSATALNSDSACLIRQSIMVLLQQILGEISFKVVIWITIQKKRSSCLFDMINIQQIGMNESEIPKRRLSQPTTNSSLKLPYLKKQKEIRYYPQEGTSQQKGKYFDLKTVNCTLPAYDPGKDKNLAYFFMKESNKKIVEDMREREKKKQRSRERSAQRELKRSHRGKIDEVSKGDFQRYLVLMRARVASEKVN